MAAKKKSTTVRPLPLVFQALEKVAPAVGGKLLDRIWFRLPPVPEKARRLRVQLPEGTPFEVPFEHGAVRGTAWGEGPTIYLVHGWGGWGLQLAAFIPPLLADGFRVVAYDGPSHGESGPGREGPGRSTMVELADAFQAVVAAQGPAYGVVAHSIGAAAISQALKSGLDPRRLVFVAAATDFQVTMDQYQAFLRFGPRIREQFLRRFTRRFGTMESFEVGAVIERLAKVRELPPLLAIHDRADRETQYQGSERLVSVWPDASLELTDGLGHNRVLWSPEVVESARKFLSADRASGDGLRVGQERMQG